MTVGPGTREAGAEPITQPPTVIECVGVGRTFGSGRTAVHGRYLTTPSWIWSDSGRTAERELEKDTRSRA